MAAKSLNFNSLANFSEPGERETLLRFLLNRKVHDSYLRKIKASSINVFFFTFSRIAYLSDKLKRMKYMAYLSKAEVNLPVT